MKTSYTSIESPSTTKSSQTRGADGKRPIVRTCAKRELANPVDHRHRYDSMARYAKLLALRTDCNRTRHATYRQLRLLMEHSDCDPALLGQEEVRDSLLFLKLDKQWKPQSMRQAVACLRLLFRKRTKTKTVPGVDFVRDDLRHVLPRGLRAIRYYGFCHPAAKKNRERIKMHTGTPIFIGPRPVAAETPPPACPRCEKPMRLVERIARCPMSRAPPGILVLRFP